MIGFDSDEEERDKEEESRTGTVAEWLIGLVLLGGVGVLMTGVGILAAVLAW